MDEISRRKDSHFEICRDRQVEMSRVSTGLERLMPAFDPLPELDLAQIDTGTTFMGRQLSFPFLVGAITGGTDATGSFNLRLAEAASRRGVGFCSGSARVALHRHAVRDGFRLKARFPELLYVGNLGLTVLKEVDVDAVGELVEDCGFDLLAFHVNPLHESFQQNGDTDFSGLADRFADFAAVSPIPVGLKTIGFGAGPALARKALTAGAAFVEVSGAGGTSWTEVERHRCESGWMKTAAAAFSDFGVPLRRSLELFRHEAPRLPLVGSGGVRSGLDIFRAVALGADVAAAALPFVRGDVDASAAELLKAWEYGFKVAMFSVGCKRVDDFAGRAVDVLIDLDMC